MPANVAEGEACPIAEINTTAIRHIGTKKNDSQGNRSSPANLIQRNVISTMSPTSSSHTITFGLHSGKFAKHQCAARVIGSFGGDHNIAHATSGSETTKDASVIAVRESTRRLLPLIWALQRIQVTAT